MQVLFLFRKKNVGTLLLQILDKDEKEKKNTKKLKLNYNRVGAMIGQKKKKKKRRKPKRLEFNFKWGQNCPLY